MVSTRYGEIVEKWRDDRKVQRVTLKLDGDVVRDAVMREILTQARAQGITLPNIEDRHSCDPMLEFYIGARGYDGEESVFIWNAQLSYYEPASPKEPK